MHAARHLAEERDRLGFELVWDAGAGQALRGNGGVEIEPDGQVRLQQGKGCALPWPSLHPLLQRRKNPGVEAAPRALVGEAGVGETVAQHGIAARQRRFDDLQQVVAPRREDQQRFGQRVHGIVENECPELFGQRGAAGFAGLQHGAPGAAQGLGQRLDVGRLAGAVDALEADENAVCRHGFHCALQSLPGARVAATYCPR